MLGTGETNRNKRVLVLALWIYSHIGCGRVIGADNAEECPLGWGRREFLGVCMGCTKVRLRVRGPSWRK